MKEKRQERNHDTLAILARRLWLLLAACVSWGCQSDADVVCERLDTCGCLTESVSACSERLDGASAHDVELCAQCLQAHDYMCHELGANHAVCGGCTDRYASPDRVRETDPDKPPYDDSAYPEVIDLQARCLEVSES